MSSDKFMHGNLPLHPIYIHTMHKCRKERERKTEKFISVLGDKIKHLKILNF